jgi:hypothetical protein
MKIFLVFLFFNWNHSLFVLCFLVVGLALPVCFVFVLFGFYNFLLFLCSRAFFVFILLLVKLIGRFVLGIWKRDLSFILLLVPWVFLFHVWNHWTIFIFILHGFVKFVLFSILILLLVFLFIYLAIQNIINDFIQWFLYISLLFNLTYYLLTLIQALYVIFQVS